jgi:hypothetical protein
MSTFVIKERRTMRYISLFLVLGLGLALAGCERQDEPFEPRPVQTFAIALQPFYSVGA